MNCMLLLKAIGIVKDYFPIKSHTLLLLLFLKKSFPPPLLSFFQMFFLYFNLPKKKTLNFRIKLNI